MRMVEQLEREGAFLFRWRSFMPLAILPAAVPALYEGTRLDLLWGHALDDLWVFVCMLLSFVGLAIRWATVGFVPAGTSGRNTHAQRADVLNTTGMYSIVRNPLYLGNFIAIAGLALSTKSWWFVLLVSFAYWLYIERIIATEERFLMDKFGAAHTDWARNTPVFVPRLSLWRSPIEPYSVRTVLRREYGGVLAVAVSFLVLEAIADLVIEGEPLAIWLYEDRVWVWLFVVSSLVFLALRGIKKHTDLLRVPGR